MFPNLEVNSIHIVISLFTNSMELEYVTFQSWAEDNFVVQNEL
jgi:hypothetical protein